MIRGDTYEYDGFGNKVNSTGTTPNNYLYRGEQFDPDLGMYYLRARYYNPLTGRFLSVDPLAGQGQRRYEYVGADPVNGMDPSGNEAIIEWALLTFYPKALPFFFGKVPPWCGFEMDGVLPGCGGGAGGTGATGAGPGAPAGPPAPPPPPKNPPPCTKCRAQMKYRPTGAGKPNGSNGPQNHSFWYVQDRSGNLWNISAGEPKNSKYLAASVYSPKILISPMMGGNFYQDFPSSPTCFDSGLKCEVCDKVDKMIQFARNWPNNRDVYNPNGPNSNSFARTVGFVGGFSPSKPPGPFPTWGWDTPLN
jgi:RHS repeat-associated protein